MSGLVGIVNLDGSPVEPALLDAMTRELAFRGPDAQRTWIRGHVGLGHTLLRATHEAEHEEQPATLEERLWIVADARIDGRAELIESIKRVNKNPGPVSESTPDSQLILQAYDSWGEGCVERLLGDFSFAIWDIGRRRLFCARDQMGVKPFYYAQVGSSFVFSNTLDCVRMHPRTSSRLNDRAIADFLLFDMNQNLSTTSFDEINRLAPAHFLTRDEANLTVKRYWELSFATPVHFRRKEEYVERFLELLDLSVADRLRTRSAGVLMSGGLDSTTIAASAKRWFDQRNTAVGLQAYTEVFDSLVPHEERQFATLAANGLGIPIEFLAIDQKGLFDGAVRDGVTTPEPANTAWPDTTSEQLRQVARKSRVVLTGCGADPALCGRITVHFSELLREGRFGRALGDAARYLAAEGRMSRLYLSRRWRILFGSKRDGAQFPGWLNEDLANGLGLFQRWETLTNGTSGAPTFRPEAHEAIADSLWTMLFDEFDPARTRLPVEVRHPFFDLRLVNYLLALPRLPWCCDKELLREAAKGVLPDPVRLRRKSPMPAEPLITLLDRTEAASLDRFEAVSELGRYVVRDRIPPVSGEKNAWAAWINLRPISLNFWLRRVHR